jgi:multiple sugar transport system ATP-binding protein
MEIRLQNLTKIFTEKSGKETRAVDDMTVTIPSGTLVGLLGPSGCGKSTTLFMIAGLHKPSGGKIYFGDDDVTRLAPEKRGIGLVFQNYALYPHMTVRQNIMFPLENLKVKRDEAEVLVQEMADLVGIGDLLDRKPAQLSGGQQQRVAIARALVKKPRVLLLDEPLSNLDARLRLQTREEIKRIQRETRITTIFVTHDQEEAMSISDQMVVMDFGVVQQMAAPQDLYNYPTNLFVAKFLGNPPINVVEGEVKGGKVLVDGKQIGTKNVPDGKYDIGVRPEDFKIDPKGFVIKPEFTSHIGRDTMIGFTEGKYNLRALVDSDSVSGAKEIRFAIKPEKIHIFDKQTGSVVLGKEV